MCAADRSASGRKVHHAAAEDNEYIAQVRKIADEEGSDVVVVCAGIEAEISELDDEEKAMFLEELGIAESGLDKRLRLHIICLT